MNIKNDDKNILTLLQKKNNFFKDVIQKTIVHIQQNKKVDILGVSDVSLCIDNLYELVKKINSLEEKFDLLNDETLYKNTENLINQLKPVSYNWKRRPNDNVNYGFIAQDMEEIIPELVDVCIDQISGNEVKSVKTTDGLVPYLVKAIQEQSTIIEEQKDIINKMVVDQSAFFEQQCSMINQIIELKKIVENLIKLNNLIPQ
jgi:hypothetical protein